MRHFVDQQMWKFKSRLSLIVRANVVLNRTVVVDSDLYLCLFCSRISTILLTYVKFFRQILMRQLAHRSTVDWLLNWQKNLQVISSFIFKQIMLYKSFTSNKEINSTRFCCGILDGKLTCRVAGKSNRESSQMSPTLSTSNFYGLYIHQRHSKIFNS